VNEIEKKAQRPIAFIANLPAAGVAMLGTALNGPFPDFVFRKDCGRNPHPALAGVDDGAAGRWGEARLKLWGRERAPLLRLAARPLLN